MENAVGNEIGNLVPTPTENNNNSSQTSSVEIQSEHSTHCDNCINIKSCKKQRSQDSQRKVKGVEAEKDIVIITCPIIYCRFNCSHQFHECKKDEHELLCSKVKVPCINLEYGCPMVLERGNKGVHLEKCPASVQVCTMEWNRWPLPPGKCQPFAFDPEQLDVAATLKDQKTLSDWKQSVPSSLRYLLKTSVSDKHPMMPLGVSGLRIPRSILNQAKLEHDLGVTDISESTESEHDESSDSPWGWKKSPPGLQESVCNKLKTLKVSQEVDQEEKELGETKGSNNNNNNINTVDEEDFHSCKSSVAEDDDNGGFIKELIPCSNDNSQECQEGCEEMKQKDANFIDGTNELNTNCSKDKKDVDLSMIVEVRTRCQRKPDSMYTFMCSREFRRDEFPGHFHEIHSGIHTQLNGWLFTRCPLANQGCSYGVDRMYPVDENYRVVYNQTAGAFCFTQNADFAHPLRNVNDKTDNEETVSLSSLPFEVLVHLTQYLDPLSLNSLSMTNRLLRDVCSCIIVDRGIVVLQWEKKDNGLGWEVTEKKWFFSTSFSPIRKWTYGDLGRITNHLKTCPCFERNIPSKPFAYPVTVDQL